jgi:hypothetical protein
MRSTRGRNPKRPVWLTREEAYRLLALVVASPLPMGELEDGVMQKVGTLCRAFLRDEAAVSPDPVPSAISPPAPRVAAAEPAPGHSRSLTDGVQHEGPALAVEDALANDLPGAADGACDAQHPARARRDRAIQVL